MRFYFHLAYGPIAAGKAIVVLKIGEWFDNANVWIRINKSKKYLTDLLKIFAL